ncbi:hypothetical protein PTKIN_Ptkin01aG0313000 [Pterospermum kingtungense]
MANSDDQQKKKRIAIIAVSSFLLVAMVIAVTVGVSINENEEEGTSNNGSKNSQVSSSMKAIKSICQPTDFQKTCEEQLKAEAGNSTDIKELVQAAFKAARKFASRAVKNSTTLRDLEHDPRSKKALDVCKQLMIYSVNELEKSLVQIEKFDVNRFEKTLADLKIWLSATITNQQTCLDGFRNTTTKAGEKMQKALNISMQLSRIGLAITTELAVALKQLQIHGVGRRLLQDDDGVPVLGHMDFNSMLDDQPIDGERRRLRRRLLQDDDRVPVLGHMDFNSMLDDQPIDGEYRHRLRRRLLQDDDGVPVLGHMDFSAMLDDQPIDGERRRRRRLLQDDDGIPVLGHMDFNSMLDDQPIDGEQQRRRRLLQDDDGVPVLGHMDFNAMLDDQPIDGEYRRSLRRLMAINPSDIKPDVVVAKDGSGDFTTIKAAMARIPLNSVKPFVIYIKEGVYEENLEFAYAMVNVALIGDGKEKTRITGHLNVADGLPTFRTATVAVNADRFFAKNIGFENSAGAAKFQAVALMVISDFSVFYNCSMDGYQDTLYVHSKRQFYRDCTISGTIDYVFGDAAAVFQNCKFVTRKPLDKQQNIVTAQGRSDARQPTALVIQNSTFIADPDLASVKDKFPTYLGRPWGNVSRTIIMESYLDDLIKPEGWTTWDGQWGLSTCFYTELNNYGPGSKTTGRVTWPGIKKIKQEEALEFTPAKFFDGDSWIKPKNVPYTSGFFKNNTKETAPKSTAI